MTLPPPPPPWPPPPPPAFPPPSGYPPPQPAGQAPNNYLVWSILVTFFCCLPFGIVAIVKSSQVNGLWGQGRFAEAQAAADSAKKWVTWAVVGGVITNAVVLAFSVFGNSDSSANAAAMLVLGL